MANTSKTIMSWGGCQVHIGINAGDDKMPASMTNIGIIKQRSTSISTSDGDTLEAKDSFGASVGREQNEGTMDLTTTVIEPSAALFQTLGISPAEASNKQLVKTLVVPNEIAVRVTPKNKGAIGVEAPSCRMSAAPAFGDDTGNELTLTFHINKTTALAENYLFARFRTTAALVDQLTDAAGS